MVKRKLSRMDGKNKAPILYNFNISMSGIHGTYTICEQGFSYPTTHSIQLSSFGENWFNFKFLFVISYLWFPHQIFYNILFIWIALIYNHVIITNSEFCFLSFTERCKQCLSSFWGPSWLVCLFISRGTYMVIKVENKTES